MNITYVKVITGSHIIYTLLQRWT